MSVENSQLKAICKDLGINEIEVDIGAIDAANKIRKEIKRLRNRENLFSEVIVALGQERVDEMTGGQR